jgi:hypothetical protein
MIKLMILANMFISIGCIMLFIVSFINDCKPSTKVTKSYNIKRKVHLQRTNI